MALRKGDKNMSKPIENFDTRLKEALHFSGMKQIELANKTGISRSSINHYLKGDYYPSTDKIYLLANALNVNESWLLGYDAPMEKPKDNLDIFVDKFNTLDDNKQKHLLTYMDFLINNYEKDNN